MSPFSQRLKALRLERHLTQLQLAINAGITPTTVARLELDYRGDDRPGKVSVGTLEKLAAALDVPVSALLEGSESERCQHVWHYAGDIVACDLPRGHAGPHHGIPAPAVATELEQDAEDNGEPAAGLA